MLQTIHDKLTGWVAYVVLGAIALVFVLWGINWTLGAPTYAAKVNGLEIGANDVRQAYQSELAQAERQANGALDEARRNEIKKRVLDEYVDNAALVTRTDDLGYRVSDAALLAEMARIPAFQVDGKFDLAHAVAVLRAQGRSVAEIETLFRRDLKARQLASDLSASSFATPSEVARVRALTREQREVGYFTLSAAAYAKSVTPDEAAVKAYYEAHKSDYMTPETVDLQYVELSLADLAAKVQVTDDQLKAYFEEQKQKTPERFTQAEQRRVRHILIAVNDPKDDAAAKAKAEVALKRAQAGEDFAKLAKELSQDPGSAPQGGDLGWSERKAFVAPFADAAFSMKEGEIRGPVKTQFGYHVLKLEGIQPASTKTFEQAKADLESEYRRSEAERLFNAAQDQLADAALQNGTDLAAVAKKAGLTVQSVTGFSRASGGGALGANPKVIEAAFSQDVLDGHLSPIVEMDQGRGVVLRATNHQVPQQKPLAEVHDAVLAAWQKARGVELATAAAQAAIDKLKAGESLEAVAKGLGVTANAPKYIGRSDASVPQEIRERAFAGPKPDKAPVFAEVALKDGDAAVLDVSGARVDPSSDAATEAIALKRQFAAREAALEAQTYAAAARDDAKVVLNPQAIE